MSDNDLVMYVGLAVFVLIAAVVAIGLVRGSQGDSK